MTSPSTPPADRVGEVAGRTVASLTKLEKSWLRRRFCGFCEAPMLGSSCYALSGPYALPVIKGVREQEETIELGPPCDMDQQRARALATYRPRAHLQSQESSNAR